MTLLGICLFMILEYTCWNISFDFLAVEACGVERVSGSQLGNEAVLISLISGKQLAEISPVTKRVRPASLGCLL